MENVSPAEHSSAVTSFAQEFEKNVVGKAFRASGFAKEILGILKGEAILRLDEEGINLEVRLTSVR